MKSTCGVTMRQTHEGLINLRKKVDSIDRQLIVILKKRFEVTHRIGVLKKEQELPIEDKFREEEQLSNLIKQSHDLGLDSKLVQNIFSLILKEAKKKHRQV